MRKKGLTPRVGLGNWYPSSGGGKAPSLLLASPCSLLRSTLFAKLWSFVVHSSSESPTPSTERRPTFKVNTCSSECCNLACVGMPSSRRAGSAMNDAELPALPGGPRATLLLALDPRLRTSVSSTAAMPNEAGPPDLRYSLLCAERDDDGGKGRR